MGVMLNAQHLKTVQSVRSVTLTEAYIQLKLVQVLSTVIHSSILILLRKSKNELYEERCYLWTRSEIRFRFT